MRGIKEGMVMQRNEHNVCDIYYSSPEKPRTVSYRPMSSSLSQAEASQGSLKVEAVHEQTYRLTGIPVGGPYTLTIDSERYEHIYVGDLWILAGQSNMEGCAKLSQRDFDFIPREDVRALYLCNDWAAARPSLHDLGSSFYQVHILLGGVPKPDWWGAGPGLSFALSMEGYTGVPQGLICCAHGGTNLAEHWNPRYKDEGPHKSLYAAMVARVRENGNRVRGMFWYQGCSDAEELLHDKYTENMIDFVHACRRDIAKDLPVVQVQIGRTISRPTREYCHWWKCIQEQQRLLHEKVENLDTVASVTKCLDDAIHLDSEGQWQLGAEAAEAMYHLVFGEDDQGCLAAPRLERYWMDRYRRDIEPLSEYVVVKLKYCNLHGSLTAQGRPMGFEVISNDPEQIPQYVYKISLEQDTVSLFLSATPDMLSGCQLYYGYAPDCPCNITDEAGRAIPVMGPLSLNL